MSGTAASLLPDDLAEREEGLSAEARLTRSEAAGLPGAAKALYVDAVADYQVAAVEDYITQTSMAAAVSDEELRPALATLARGTGDLETAQKGLGLALDVAAGTGKPLAQVC